MRLVWLFESVEGLRGHALRALRDAEALAARGHDVLVLAKDAGRAECGTSVHPDVPTLRVSRFDAASIPVCDVVLATHWTTVEAAVACGRGLAVQCCAGYEPSTIDDPELRERAAAVHRWAIPRIATSPHVAELLRAEAPGGTTVAEVVTAIDSESHVPAAEPRAPGAALRVGLIGPIDRDWQGIAEGLEACRRAAAAGIAIEVVRVTPHRAPGEANDMPFPIEWHEGLEPAAMAELMRSLDLLVAPATGPEQGCYLPPIEAMACGVPCILTDVPSHLEYAPERRDHALFVEAGEVQQLAEAIVLLAGHPPLRAALRTAGFEVARRYTPERHIEQVERALERLVEPVTAGEETATADELASTTNRVASRLPAVLPEPETARTPHPERRVDLLQRGDRLLAADRPSAALRAFEAAAVHDPEDACTLDRLGSAAFRSGDAPRALQCFDAVLARAAKLRARDRGELHAKRATVLLAMERFEDAASAFEQAGHDGHADAESCNGLGLARYALGDAAGARAAFEDAMRRDAGHAAAANNLRALDARAVSSATN